MLKVQGVLDWVGMVETEHSVNGETPTVCKILCLVLRRQREKVC